MANKCPHGNDPDKCRDCEASQQVGNDDYDPEEHDPSFFEQSN